MDGRLLFVDLRALVSCSQDHLHALSLGFYGDLEFAMPNLESRDGRRKKKKAERGTDGTTRGRGGEERGRGKRRRFNIGWPCCLLFTKQRRQRAGWWWSTELRRAQGWFPVYLHRAEDATSTGSVPALFFSAIDQIPPVRTSNCPLFPRSHPPRKKPTWPTQQH